MEKYVFFLHWNEQWHIVAHTTSEDYETNRKMYDGRNYRGRYEITARDFAEAELKARVIALSLTVYDLGKERNSYKEMADSTYEQWKKAVDTAKSLHSSPDRWKEIGGLFDDGNKDCGTG